MRLSMSNSAARNVVTGAMVWLALLVILNNGYTTKLKNWIQDKSNSSNANSTTTNPVVTGISNSGPTSGTGLNNLNPSSVYM